MSYKKCCQGSTISCINPFHNPIGDHLYFRHIPNCKHFDRNDVAKICPTCWGQAQIMNGTLTQVPIARLQNAWREHLSKNKPGKDTL